MIFRRTIISGSAGYVSLGLYLLRGDTAAPSGLGFATHFYIVNFLTYLISSCLLSLLIYFLTYLFPLKIGTAVA